MKGDGDMEQSKDFWRVLDIIFEFQSFLEKDRVEKGLTVEEYCDKYALESEIYYQYRMILLSSLRKGRLQTIPDNCYIGKRLDSGCNSLDI